MKDWYELIADVDLPMNKHYTRGRAGRKIEYVVIHHNAGINSVKGVWDIWQYRRASAHYQVQSDGLIGQLVDDWNTAWHALDSEANFRSIGIEVSNSGGPDQDWPIADKAIEETAHLVAAICRLYELGRPRAGLNVKFHKDFAPTGCPWHLAPGGKYHDQLMSRAQFWFDEMTKPAEENFLSDLTPEEQRELLHIGRYLFREFTQKYPSRSAYRANDEPVDTFVGMGLNTDARAHELWIEAQAEKAGMDPMVFAQKLNGASE